MNWVRDSGTQTKYMYMYTRKGSAVSINTNSYTPVFLLDLYIFGVDTYKYILFVLVRDFLLTIGAVLVNV